MPEILGRDVALGPSYPHGSNIFKKLNDRDVQADTGKAELIGEIASRYLQWRDSALAVDASNEEEFVRDQVGLYQTYRDLLDEPRVDVFDSRGALQPSALEEFCFFLFHPAIEQYETEMAVGHYEVYQGLYFTAPKFSEFAIMPTPNYPVGNLDFVIGKRLESKLSTDADERTHIIYVPAVAVECKTYLDRPRWVESDNLAASIKRGFPRCLYVVISEFLKLDLSKVNVIGSLIDHVYVFRRAQNVDRRIRRTAGTGLQPLHVPAVLDFYQTVKAHLSEDWEAPEDWTTTGILK